ncbi:MULTISPECIES: transposase family protein [unclassified Microcoleus]
MSAPHKKTKNQDLTTEPKTENRKRAQKRIVVEQIIRVVKIFRVAAERFG